jgi:hypothetical protein
MKKCGVFVLICSGLYSRALWDDGAGSTFETKNLLLLKPLNDGNPAPLPVLLFDLLIMLQNQILH